MKPVTWVIRVYHVHFVRAEIVSFREVGGEYLTRTLKSSEPAFSGRCNFGSPSRACMGELQVLPLRRNPSPRSGRQRAQPVKSLKSG